LVWYEGKSKIVWWILFQWYTNIW